VASYPNSRARRSWLVESIRKFNHAVPFARYEIHTASGEALRSATSGFHPDFPKGSFVIVFGPEDPKEVPHHLNALLIERSVMRRLRLKQVLKFGSGARLDFIRSQFPQKRLG